MMKGILLLIFFLFFTGNSAAKTICKISDISVKSVKAKFVTDNYGNTKIQGAATIINHCSEGVGVQVSLIAYDSNGDAIQVNDFWPGSISNISPGEFSFDLWGVKYDPDIVSLKVVPIGLNKY